MEQSTRAVAQPISNQPDEFLQTDRCIDYAKFLSS